ncbi:FG-GAP-like repeat-containing protein [Spongiimicrobium sp. 3-5]|uniref:FG-GAP-like repeat-containing protein n=1 Tax=Spongiimicrobium sp. 3-5 TaxID=3332596 RepID=UPI00398182E4
MKNNKRKTLGLKYVAFALLATTYFQCSKDYTIEENTEQTELTSSGQDNVKLLTLNVGFGANREYNCDEEINPTIDKIRFGDFDGDDKIDVFSVDDCQWRYSSGGDSNWINLNSTSDHLDELRFGDFDGDGKTDVFSKNGSQWRYSCSGSSLWTNLNSSTDALSQLRFGYFDGDDKTDVFSYNNGDWRFSSGGSGAWENLNTSTDPLSELRFGDFNGDGKTDVFSYNNGDWRYSSGGEGPWVDMSSPSVSPALDNLRFGDFNGDDTTDVFSIDNDQWRYYNAQDSSWVNLNSSTKPLSELRFEDFDGDGTTDVFSISSEKEWRYSDGGNGPWEYLSSPYCRSCVKPLFLKEHSVKKIADFIYDEFNFQDLDGIICLQEVDTNYKYDGKDVLGHIKDKLGNEWYSEFFSPENSSYGIAIISNISNTKKQLWNLPQEGNSEKRGAIALKFQHENNQAWVVNTHLGLTALEREHQIDTIVAKYQTFTTNVPVTIVGDFNVADTYRIGSNFRPNGDEISHYNNTIGDLTKAGLSKLEYESSETHPMTFHSWNSFSKSKILDYIFWRDPNNNKPEVSNLSPGPFDADESKCLCPGTNPANRYLTDHNGVVLDYNIFGL